MHGQNNIKLVCTHLYTSAQPNECAAVVPCFFLCPFLLPVASFDVVGLQPARSRSGIPASRIAISRGTLLLALQPLVDLSLFQNCPPLFSILLLTSPVPNAHVLYTGCPRRNVQYFGRVCLMLNYTDITQNTYIQSWTVTEIMAREVWNFDSCYTLIDYQIHIETGRNMWFI